MNVFKSELISFFNSVKAFFIDIYNSIHNFLLRYLDSTTLGVLAIAAAAALLMFIFKRVNHD